MKKILVTLAVVLVVCLSAGTAVHALINPNFTPLDVTEQSKLILTITFAPPKDHRCVGTIKKVLKGKTDLKTVTLDLNHLANEDELAIIERRIKAHRNDPAIFFQGRFCATDQDEEAGKATQYLHLGAKWLDISRAECDVWIAERTDSFKEATWAGGSDMLIRAVEYILADENADVPCVENAEWAKITTVGKVPGKVTSAQSVDLDGNGKPYLVITSDRGDRLYFHDGEALKDVTQAKKLRSKSKVSCWLDANQDGRIDLVSWDGRALSLHTQNGDGTFKPAASIPTDLAAEGCVGLSAIDIGMTGRPGLLISTGRCPVIKVPGISKLKAQALMPDDFKVSHLGRAAACIHADFDGDALPDIVQPFEKGGLLYRATALGQFRAPVACAVSVRGDVVDACVGDFDADGLLDIATTGIDGVEIWHNRGGGRFQPTKHVSGEIAYISKSNTVACGTCDINCDGRQDLFLAYAAKGPQLFFNRGFRSTGHAHKLDVDDNGLMPEATDGQQTGCVGDFNHDGAHDMVLVLKNGNVAAFFIDSEAMFAVSLKYDLPAVNTYCGPITVTGRLPKRSLGAWNVVPGTSTAFFGLPDSDACTVTYRFPGAGVQKQSQKTDDPKRVVLVPQTKELTEARPE